MIGAVYCKKPGATFRQLCQNTTINARIDTGLWSQMLDKFDELSSWSRNAHRGGRIHRSLRHFPLRRVALDFVEGTEHAFSLRHCVGMTLRSGI